MNTVPGTTKQVSCFYLGEGEYAVVNEAGETIRYELVALDMGTHYEQWINHYERQPDDSWMHTGQTNCRYVTQIYFALTEV